MFCCIKQLIKINCMWKLWKSNKAFIVIYVEPHIFTKYSCHEQAFFFVKYNILQFERILKGEKKMFFAWFWRILLQEGFLSAQECFVFVFVCFSQEGLWDKSSTDMKCLTHILEQLSWEKQTIKKCVKRKSTTTWNLFGLWNYEMEGSGSTWVLVLGLRLIGLMRSLGSYTLTKWWGYTTWPTKIQKQRQNRPKDKDNDNVYVHGFRHSN